ncbi:DUF4145 domain-containing protein [Paraburkholderia metrosideri]|uniref:DUF4145 domain-containing protein n=1 Tax=Paraburkholderia metrosideri TaxID=580937 RepID=A0ABW9DPU4_9BURK
MVHALCCRGENRAKSSACATGGGRARTYVNGNNTICETKMAKIVEPSTRETAFNCPHCGALSTQHWSKLYSETLRTDDKRPPHLSEKIFKNIEQDSELDSDSKEIYKKFFARLLNGEVFLDPRGSSSSVYPDANVENVFISQCYNCNDIAIWLHHRLLYPVTRAAIDPNEDLNSEIRLDFEEARTILDLSPRGAAALLRLAVQKLCAQLGEPGENIDKDIAALVQKGLNPIVQKSLDIVRVIGNESVHPGELDMRDDRDTALQLFGLVNAIAEQMISHPKRVEQLYAKLPEAKRNGIEVRNAKARGNNKSAD